MLPRRISDRTWDGVVGPEKRETHASNPLDEDDVRRIRNRYERKYKVSSMVGGLPTSHFQKHLERITRYNGRRVPRVHADFEFETVYRHGVGVREAVVYERVSTRGSTISE
jgi:hypothetical protein